ncbi:hypothetical protein QBC33DRAFT_30463 [Phialemonium atrogriseum]|uniref:Uncharacterized protein n=1 Tax=Phialemonium atrogriseum TaxID=1093897 RepID=A0AAJ0FLP3_9PEZI|nr:uncharacterized protein QBC33DRAFT_30463 [Phialemonium atrogriseum]KAK1772811.1 hypothetical protein QBC33DRAFT_30463 [Phialemonium atrogriseum]
MTTCPSPSTPNLPQLPEPRNGCRNGGCNFLANLSPETLMNILEQLRPFGSLTTYESNAGKPEIRPDHSESRLAFANLCLVSKWIRPYAIRHLYHTVLLKDQKELLYFFRTIANNHDLRSTIRSVAWAGVLSTDDANLDSTHRRDKEMDCLAPECWASIDWPSSPIDFDIARLMGIDGPETLQSWRVLGAVLAMIPRVRSLFVLLAHMPITPPRLPPCPEKDAIWALIRPPKSNSYQFLQELRKITLEPHHKREDFVLAHGKIPHGPLGELTFGLPRRTEGHVIFQINATTHSEILGFSDCLGKREGTATFLRTPSPGGHDSSNDNISETGLPRSGISRWFSTKV